ncbi:MAG: class I SAM-dependent methyltransferase [Candidatus Omnitrophica bacterium]|nr:class I SAM-dependent methyltransferase [Candidatus Omnitrophota bacterium]
MPKRDFDKEAASWDSPVRTALAGTVTEAILRQVELTPEMDVLDFGCGTGLVTLRLAPLVRSVTGVDTSAGMLQVLRAKLLAQNIGNVQAELLNTQGELVLPGEYHAIVSSMTLHHVEDVLGLLRKFHQALLPGGRVAVTDLDLEGGRFHENNDGVFHFGFDRARLQSWFAVAGFNEIRHVTATTIFKPSTDNNIQEFPVFLLTASRQ